MVEKCSQRSSLLPKAGSALASLFALFAVSVASASAGAFELKTQWRDHDQVAGGRAWGTEDFSKLKHKSYRDKDPASGSERSWNGVLLSDFLNNALDKMALQQRAAVDLLVMKTRDGKQTYIPRVFVEKYPVLLSLDGSSVGTMVPMQSVPKIRNERLPVESYFLSDVQSIEFTTYQTVFGSFYLKKRSDPRSIKGEAFVVKNCLSCHGDGGSPQTQSRILASNELSKSHPKVTGYHEPAQDEQRAIASYLNARKQEAPVAVPAQ